MLSIDELFKGRHFDQEIIVVSVRWYLRFKLSFRDLVEMMAERGVALAHTTIMRWVQRYAPEFEKRWNRFACKVGRSWRVDETYVKIKGRWTYLYRAVDSAGKTVDFLLRTKRDVAAAKAFFRRAFKTQGRLPRAITLDGYQASHRAVREVLGKHRHGKRTVLRSSKYLNNLIEQDHRFVKLRLGPMLGFKRFQTASTTIAGIELMHRIRKGQFNLGSLASMTKPCRTLGMPFSQHDASSGSSHNRGRIQSLHQSHNGHRSVGGTSSRRRCRPLSSRAYRLALNSFECRRPNWLCLGVPHRLRGRGLRDAQDPIRSAKRPLAEKTDAECQLPV